MSHLTETEAESILYDWRWNARPNQLMPGTSGAEKSENDWRFWLILAGRGWGKSRVGAETVRTWAEDPNERILMIAPTSSDVRDVMIEGPSGLMSCYPPSRKPRYNSSRHVVEFPSGAIGITRTAESPERLRGPQFRKFWFDEICAAQYQEEAWNQVMFGFRLPTPNLQGIITTTPKPTKTLKSIIANPKTIVTRGSSYDNRSNLSPEYYRDVIKPFEGTRLGRQEINAEILEDVPGALWTRGLIEATRITSAQIKWEFLVRIVVAIDPAVTSREDSDETGIIVAALTNTGHVIVIDDLSGKYSPSEWARVAIAALKSRGADRIIGEVNNGGDLVERNIRAEDPNTPFQAVRASRGKAVRAEPVAALYEQGRVHHAGSLGKLEDQMTNWTPYGNERSPDRLDALVWAVTGLVLDLPSVTQTILLTDPEYQISPV
jgi:predicted phage terminase large subunit-like protein